MTMIQIMRSKIHNARVTGTDAGRTDGIAIDEDLMDAVDLLEGEQVHVVSHASGERIVTSVIREMRGSGRIRITGPAALRIGLRDKIIIIAYAELPAEQARDFRPKIIFPRPDNSIRS